MEGLPGGVLSGPPLLPLSRTDGRSVLSGQAGGVESYSRSAQANTGIEAFVQLAMFPRLDGLDSNHEQNVERQEGDEVKAESGSV